uniref:Uncharacterized protein n=1 Tax=Ditylenchus dipsaci TaxID=166011 RepID=A0A915DRN6_9BILA
MINLRDTGVKKSWMRNVVLLFAYTMLEWSSLLISIDLIVHQISLKGNDYCEHIRNFKECRSGPRDDELIDYVKPKLEIVEVKIENMWEAAESLKVRNQLASTSFKISLEELQKRELRLQADKEELKKRELRLQADKEELKKHREVLFEQIRKATGVKRHKPSSQWPGDKDGFFKRGPRIDHVRSMHPTIWERNLPGSRKYTPVTVSSLDTQHASSSALADLGKNEKFQIAPPNKRHKKKEEKQDGKQFGTRHK